MNEKEPGPLRHEDYLEGTRQLLEQSAQEQKPYRITVLGEEFIVLPKVFSPKYFKDTEFFARRPPAKIHHLTAIFSSKQLTAIISTGPWPIAPLICTL